MNKFFLIILLFPGFFLQAQTSKDVRYWRTNGNTVKAGQSLGSINNQSLKFRTNDSLRVIIDNSGKVGIGNDIPGTLLDIGSRNDIILEGAAALLNIGRLATRYTSTITSGFILGTGSYVNQTNPSSGSIQALEGFAHTSHNSGSVTLAIGTLGNAETSGEGETMEARGVQGGVSIRNSGGGINASAFYAAPSGNVGGGTGIFTNGYGMYIGKFGSGFTNKFGIYVSDSTASNFFAGNLKCPAIEVFKGPLKFSNLITPKGITGKQTINKISGIVNIAAGNKTIVVSNDLVTENSLVFAVIRSNDATALLKNVVSSNGSFQINLDSAASSETSIGFFVMNQ